MIYMSETGRDALCARWYEDREERAMVEARRILNATGPGWLTLTAHPCYGGRALTGYPSVFAVLAESLGAAVADGGLLDQLELDALDGITMTGGEWDRASGIYDRNRLAAGRGGAR